MKHVFIEAAYSNINSNSINRHICRLSSLNGLMMRDFLKFISFHIYENEIYLFLNTHVFNIFSKHDLNRHQGLYIQ